MRIVNSPNHLKNKVGSGGIPQSLIDEAEKHIASAYDEFEDYVRDQLEKLKRSCQAISNKETLGEKEQLILITPIMMLKAHGTMFGYELISDMSYVVLDFLERIDFFNDDAGAILDVYQKSASVIINRKLQAGGGRLGLDFSMELTNACERYYNKHSC